MQKAGVNLVGSAGDTEPPDLDRCIICQTLTEHATTSTENGRKRVIENKENPFKTDATQPKLHNTMTQEVMMDEIRNQVLQVEAIGTEAYDKLRKERFVEKSVWIFQTIHRTNLKTFLSIRTASKGQEAAGKSQTQKEDKHRRRVVEIARARGISMRELMEYDLTSSSYLFDKQGLMSKCNKSALMNEMEKNLTKDATVLDDSNGMQVGYIADVMANARKIKTKEYTTFGGFSGAIVDYIQHTARNADRIDYVFDSYFDISIKDSERRRRETTSPIELNVISEDTPLPVQMELFWPANRNKHNLEILLHQEAMKRAQENPESNMMVFVSNFSNGESDQVPCLSSFGGNCTNIPELCLDIEEADTRIIPHALHAVQNKIQRLVVLSPDTDVFVLLLYYWDVLHQNGLCELWLKAGSGDSTRHIPIHSLAAQVGRDLCQVLPAVHTLTGFDYTSKVGTKPAALKANPIDYLKGFDCSRNGPSQDDIERAESYLVQVMKKGTTFTTMDELRDHNFHHSKGATLEQLPPTSHALEAHILRAYYATYVMTTFLSASETDLNPLLYGYEEKDELLLPDMAIRPIPDEHAVVCTCLKCGTERCACRKSGQPCCQFCKCQVMGDENACCKNPAGCVWDKTFQGQQKRANDK